MSVRVTLSEPRMMMGGAVVDVAGPVCKGEAAEGDGAGVGGRVGFPVYWWGDIVFSWIAGWAKGERDIH